MPRIIVTTDPVDRQRPSVSKLAEPVLLDESVDSLHLIDDHSSAQLIERLAWAVTDAEDIQRAL